MSSADKNEGTSEEDDTRKAENATTIEEPYLGKDNMSFYFMLLWNVWYKPVGHRRVH